MISAGIDIGSNTLRLIIADIEDRKINKILYEDSKITRLGEGLLKTGELNIKKIETTINKLKEFKKIIDKYTPERLKVISTSAIREAKNKDIFIEKAKSIGLNVEIIDGKTEGYYTYLGVSSVIDLNDKTTLIFDIGGGSTEFIETGGGNVKHIESLPLGVVKIANEYNVSDIVKTDTKEKISLYIRNILTNLKCELSIELLVGTAGTATTFAAMDQEMEIYDYKKINGYILKKEKIEFLIDKLSHLKATDRLNIKGLEKGREDLIIPGGLIILAVLDKFKKDEFKVADFGLREGVAIAATFY